MKKVVSFLLSLTLVMGLAACGKKADSSSAASQEPTPEPVAEEKELEVAFLTGLEKDANYPKDKRITAVMVNNIAQARPQRGLSDAKILTEIKVEGGITRFMAMYDDYEEMPEVGPVRSARDQFFQLLIPFWGFYVHDGPNQNQPTNWMIRDYEYEEFDLQPMYDANLTWRDQGRISAGYSQEHTEYTNGEKITASIKNRDLDTERSYGSPIFSFVPYNEEPRVPEEGAAAEVAIPHSQSYLTYFGYDDALAEYQMSMSNVNSSGMSATVDENNGEQLAFTNLLILFAPMNLYPDPGQANTGLMQVHYENGGAGYLFTQGHYELVMWRKEGPDKPLVLLSGDKTESPVFLNPGKTYIGVVDDMELEGFYNTLKSGDAQAVAAQGVVDENQQEIED